VFNGGRPRERPAPFHSSRDIRPGWASKESRYTRNVPAAGVSGTTTVRGPFADKSWLRSLVEEALLTEAPGSVRSRAPTAFAPPGQPPDIAAAARILVARSLRVSQPPPPRADDAGSFRDTVRQHLLLLLELRRLQPAPPDPARARADVAAFLAASLGAEALALEAADDPPSPRRDRAVERALAVAGKELLARFFPPGDPRTGLPLHSGAVAVLRRHLGRVASGFVRQGRLDPEAIESHAQYAERELALLAEALSGLLRSAEAPDRRARRVRSRQMVRLGLRGAVRREARRRVAEPRSPEDLGAAAPGPMRGFLFEQLLMAQLRSRLTSEGPSRFVEAFAQAAGLEPQGIVAAQLEAAAQSGDPQAWFEGFSEGGVGWHGLPEDWGSAADHVVGWISTAVTQNLGALVTEIRETGELGALLAKAAAGVRLTSDEKRKIRSQLADLARAVPALAIFAAPGGALLLPILVKLLPFNLLPSAWDKVGAEPSTTAPAAPAEPREPGGPSKPQA
jgi:hypothetical protein